MKRIITIASTGATLLAVALLPAAASAHGQHHRHHHARAHARIQSFGTGNPVAPASASAGTVTSFTAGVLTIKLSDGTSVTGKVTTATELKCEPAAAAPIAQTADQSSSGGDSGSAQTPAGDGHGGPGSSDSQSTSGVTPAVEPADENGQDIGEAEDQQNPPANGGEVCDITSLTPGAVIRQAELSVTSAGAAFVEVEIIR
jgi:hypothetical protein